MSSHSAETGRVTVPQLVAMKSADKKIAVLTAYDFTTATLLDRAGVDAILVGDSLGMVVQGHATTLPVTLEQMIYHTEIVARAVRRALVIADMPFPMHYLGPIKAVEAAGRILKETGCQAVKLESGSHVADVIAAMVDAGIPVMGHVGLRPQSVHQLGGFKVNRDARQLADDAAAAADAGAFSIVLECVPAELASQISQSLSIPTIGIGAGAGCDGQVLVTNDMLGLTTGHVPRFVREYADLKSTILEAADQYCQQVRNGTFPAEQHAFK